ncbi:MAG: hypothetical protein AAB821_01410, partial [Patescibacteria group bacterium]
GTIAPTSFKLQVKGNVGPDADNTYNLGSSALRWKNVFAQNLIATNLCSGVGSCKPITEIINGGTGANSWTAGPSGSIYRQNGTVAIGTNTPDTNANTSLQILRNKYNNVKIEVGDDPSIVDEQAQIMFKTPNKWWNVGMKNTGDFHFYNGAIRLALKNNGDVIVGNGRLSVGTATIDSSTKLNVLGNTDLQGNVLITGTVKISGGEPRAGRVLTSNATGNATWLKPTASFYKKEEIKIIDGGTTQTVMCNDGESVVSGGGRIERSDAAIAFGLEGSLWTYPTTKNGKYAWECVTPTGQGLVNMQIRCFAICSTAL